MRLVHPKIVTWILGQIKLNIITFARVCECLKTTKIPIPGTARNFPNII